MFMDILALIFSLETFAGIATVLVVSSLIAEHIANYLSRTTLRRSVLSVILRAFLHVFVDLFSLLGRIDWVMFLAIFQPLYMVVALIQILFRGLFTLLNNIFQFLFASFLAPIHIMASISRFLLNNLPRVFIFFGQIYWLFHRIVTQVRQWIRLSDIYAQQALIYEQKQQFDRAIIYYKKALKNYRIQFSPALLFRPAPHYLIPQIQWLEKIGDILSKMPVKKSIVQTYYRDALDLINKLPLEETPAFIALHVKYAQLCHDLAMTKEGLAIKHCLEDALSHLNQASSALLHFKPDNKTALDNEIGQEVTIVLHELDDEQALIAHYQQRVAVLTQMAEKSNDKGEWDDALNYYQQALVLFKFDTPSPALYTQVLQEQQLKLIMHIAKTQSRLGQWQTALLFYQQSNDMLDEPLFLSQTTWDLQRVYLKEQQAMAYRQLDDSHTAIALLHEALELRETSPYLRGQRVDNPKLAKRLDKERALTYEKMGDEQKKQHAYQHAFNCYSQAIELYEALHQILFANSINPDLGRLYHKAANSLFMEKNDSAQGYYQKELNENQTSGDYFYGIGDIDTASKYYLFADRLYEQGKVTIKNCSDQQADNLFKLASIFNALGRPDKAYTNGLRALSLFESLSKHQQKPFQSQHLQLQINLLDSLREMNQLDQALAFGKNALKMQQQHLVSAKQYPRLLIHLAMILTAKAGVQPWMLLSARQCKTTPTKTQQKWIQKAESMYRESLSIYPSQGKQSQVAIMFIHLQNANLFHSLCQWERALSHYQQAETIYFHQNFNKNAEIDILAARLYSDMGYAHQALLTKNLSINSYSNVMSYYDTAESYYNKSINNPLLNKQRLILFLRVAGLWQQMRRWTFSLGALKEALQLLITSPYDSLWSQLALELCQILFDIIEKANDLEDTYVNDIYFCFQQLLLLFPEAVVVTQNNSLQNIQMKQSFAKICNLFLRASLYTKRPEPLFNAILALASLRSSGYFLNHLQQSLKKKHNLNNKQRCSEFPNDIQQQANALQLITNQLYLPSQVLNQNTKEAHQNLSDRQNLHQSLYEQYQLTMDKYRQLKQILFEADVFTAYMNPLFYINAKTIQQQIKQKSGYGVVSFWLHEPSLPAGKQSVLLCLHPDHWDIVFLPQFVHFLTPENNTETALYKNKVKKELWQPLAAQLSFAEKLWIVPIASTLLRRQQLLKLPFNLLLPQRLQSFTLYKNGAKDFLNDFG